jgi:hypothetical protein
MKRRYEIINVVLACYRMCVVGKPSNKGTELNFDFHYFPTSNVNNTVKIKSDPKTLKHNRSCKLYLYCNLTSCT